ncbi:MAG: hypothetical protein JNK05_36075 [Myxococcales bacterium]|nr:hypothetical protein [Myxococcales bacterium]
MIRFTRRMIVILPLLASDCTCRRSEDEGTQSGPPQPAAPTPTTPTTPASPTLPSTPTSPTADAVVQAWLTQNALANDPSRYVLFDLNGDGLVDVLHDGGIAIRTASGWSESNPTLATGSGYFARPVATARGAVFALGNTGHDTDHNAGTTTSSTWVDWNLYRVNGTDAVDLMADRFDEGGPFGMPTSIELSSLPDGSISEHAGNYYRALAFRGERVVPATCWRTTPWPSSARIASCTGTSNAGLHLRDVETAEAGDSYEIPSGTALPILAASSVRRGAARLYCVDDGSHEPGWVFFTDAELSGCPPFAP